MLLTLILAFFFSNLKLSPSTTIIVISHRHSLQQFFKFWWLNVLKSKIFEIIYRTQKKLLTPNKFPPMIQVENHFFPKPKISTPSSKITSVIILTFSLVIIFTFFHLTNNVLRISYNDLLLNKNGALQQEEK